MANDKIEFDILTNGTPAVNEINKVNKAQGELENKTKSSNEAIGESWVKTGAKIYGAVVALKAVYDATGKQLQAEVALATALKNSNSVVDKNSQAWRDYASSIQAVTLYGDEAIIPLIAMGAQMGMTDETIRATIEAATDLAAATGGDLTQAFKNLGKTLTGQAEEEIVSMATELKGLTKEQLLAGEGIDLVAKKYKGAAAEMASTDYGEVQQQINRIGDEFENLGNTLLDFASQSGALWVFGKAVDLASWGISRLGTMAVGTRVKIKEFFGTVTDEDRKDWWEALEKDSKAWATLTGEIDTARDALAKQSETRKATGLKGYVNNTDNEQAEKKIEEFKEKIKELQEEMKKVGATDWEKAKIDLSKLDRQWTKLVEDAREAGAITQEQAEVMTNAITESIGKMNRENYQKILTDPYLEAFGSVEQKLDQLVRKYRDMGFSMAESTEMATREMYSSWYDTMESMGNSTTQLQNVAMNAFGNFEDSLVNMAKTGKISFKDLANSILEDLLRMTIQMTITRNLMAGMTGFFPSTAGGSTGNVSVTKQAQGGVFDGSGMARFAQGGVFSRPTDFRFAGGAGLLGEKGAEAIMPLKRTANGDLGVVASGGASNVKVEVINQSSHQVEASNVQVTQSEQEGMIIGIVVNDIRRGGAVAQAMRS